MKIVNFHGNFHYSQNNTSYIFFGGVYELNRIVAVFVSSSCRSFSCHNTSLIQDVVEIEEIEYALSKAMIFMLKMNVDIIQIRGLIQQPLPHASLEP